MIIGEHLDHYRKQLVNASLALGTLLFLAAMVVINFAIAGTYFFKWHTGTGYALLILSIITGAVLALILGVFTAESLNEIDYLMGRFKKLRSTP